MKVLTHIETAQLVAKTLKKPVIFISFWGDNWEGLLQAAPYLNDLKHGQVLADGQGIIICNSVQEQQKLYWQTVGDDGPTETNPYHGSARVYALTINAKGQTQNENT